MSGPGFPAEHSFAGSGIIVANPSRAPPFPRVRSAIHDLASCSALDVCHKTPCQFPFRSLWITPTREVGVLASHFSTGVEYALHCLLYLAHREGAMRAASVRDLAELQQVPGEYLAKLFTRMQKAGLITSVEGIGGGVRLAREASEISVLDVVRAIDGVKSLFECKEIRQRCVLFGEKAPGWSTAGFCSIHLVMLDAQARMEAALASRTLQDIANQVAVKAPADFTSGVETWLDQQAAQRGRKKKELS